MHETNGCEVGVDEGGCGWRVGSGCAVSGCGRCANGLRGCSRAEVAHAGDGTDRLVDIRRPVKCRLLLTCCTVVRAPYLLVYPSLSFPFPFLYALCILQLPNLFSPCTLTFLAPHHIVLFCSCRHDDRCRLCGYGGPRIRGGGRCWK